MSNAQRVLVLDTNRQPLMPCHPARARELLRKGKAAVFRRYPFTIILKDRESGETQPIQIKIDPGSKVTGLALVGDFKRGKKVLWGAELTHRGLAIKLKIDNRRHLRSNRRARKTRFRKPRVLNRRPHKGQLRPSLLHRVLTTQTWVARLLRWTPANFISMELVRFDTQKIQNPEIEGAQYSQGTLWGYEIKGYLLEKWGNKCVYCGIEGVPLEVEHIYPRSKGGTDRVSNLTLACVDCNKKKGNKLVGEFLAKKPELLERLLAQARSPLRDASAVNATRWQLHSVLKSFGYPVEVGTGGRTKFNRYRQGFAKTHWIDAVCVGKSGESVRLPRIKPLEIKCLGRGHRQICKTDKFGVPKDHRTRQKVFFGFQTGDIARAVLPKGKYAGIHVGRISVRSRPWFRIGVVDFQPRFAVLLQRMDGYDYRC